MAGNVHNKKVMRFLVTCFAFGISVSVCQAQEILTLRYVGHRYKETMNTSFLNDEL